MELFLLIVIASRSFAIRRIDTIRKDCIVPRNDHLIKDTIKNKKNPHPLNWKGIFKF